MRPGPKVLLLSSHYQYNISLPSSKRIEAYYKRRQFPLGPKKKKRNKRIGLRRDPTYSHWISWRFESTFKFSHVAATAATLVRKGVAKVCFVAAPGTGINDVIGLAAGVPVLVISLVYSE